MLMVKRMQSGMDCTDADCRIGGLVVAGETRSV